MLEAAGSEAIFKTAIKQTIVMFKEQQANVPEEMWVEMETELLKTSIDDIVNLLSPVYAKHLTEADLLKIIEFYQTPAGKKYAEKTPVIMQETMAVGREWGMQLGQKIQEKLKAKGY